MYRLLLYYLLVLVGFAAAGSLAGLLTFNPLSILLSASFLVLVCWLTNTLFAKTFSVASNTESFFITALILTLIITPARNLHDLIFLFWAGVLAMAGKYILAIKKKHLFNPAALAVFLTAAFLNQSASWWVGTAIMSLPVVLGGFLIARKISRWDLVLAFLATATLTTLATSFFSGLDLITLLGRIYLDSPILFFAFAMLTEPLTTPPTQNLRIIYGSLVGFLFAPQVHLGQMYFTPESALLIGNVFSFLVSPKERHLFRLKEKIALTPNISDFVFATDRKLAFRPGQYLEWTLGHNPADSRGNRRYLTITSSPTEENVRLGIKFSQPPSSFKKTLLALPAGGLISASNLAGDFTLPKNISQKLAFIAGGIGITPFRSMVKFLTDTAEKRDIILLYSNKTADEAVYQNVFSQAEQAIGLKTVYSVGRFTKDQLLVKVPDFKERLFYLSGPHSMVENFEQILKEIGVAPNQIKTDYFPGYA